MINYLNAIEALEMMHEKIVEKDYFRSQEKTLASNSYNSNLVNSIFSKIKRATFESNDYDFKANAGQLKAVMIGKLMITPFDFNLVDNVIEVKNYHRNNSLFLEMEYND